MFIGTYIYIYLDDLKVSVINRQSSVEKNETSYYLYTLNELFSYYSFGIEGFYLKKNVWLLDKSSIKKNLLFLCPRLLPQWTLLGGWYMNKFLGSFMISMVLSSPWILFVYRSTIYQYNVWHYGKWTINDCYYYVRPYCAPRK